MVAFGSCPDVPSIGKTQCNPRLVPLIVLDLSKGSLARHLRDFTPPQKKMPHYPIKDGGALCRH